MIARGSLLNSLLTICSNVWLDTILLTSATTQIDVRQERSWRYCSGAITLTICRPFTGLVRYLHPTASESSSWDSTLTVGNVLRLVSQRQAMLSGQSCG